MVSSGVNIKVGIDVSQAKTGLEQLRREFEALGSTRPKSNLTFLDTIKTSLNSIKNTMNQLKSAFTQGFSVIEKSADGTNTVLKSISVSLDKTSKSAEKATKSVETLGSSLTSAGMKSDEAFLTAEQKTAKFNAKIEKMIGTINRLNQDELRFAKTPFDTTDKFFAINRELMQTIGYLKKGEQGADLLRKAFTTLGDGEDINKIAGSLTQLEERVGEVNAVMNTLKASTVSLNQVGLGTKSLGDWGKVNSEMLQSDKTVQQLKNKLLSLDEVQFSNVYNSVQLLRYAMQEGLIPELINANNKLKEYQANAKRLSDNMIIRSGKIQKMSLLGSTGDLQTLERVPKVIQEISKAYNEGALSTERYIARMKEAVAGLSNQQYGKLTAEITRYESKLKMLGSTIEQLQTIAKSNVSLTPFNAKSDVTVQYLVRQYEQGLITIKELNSRLSSLNTVQVNPKIQPFIKDLQEGKISTEQLKVAVESLQNVNLGANVQVKRLVEQLRTGKITAEELRTELMKLNETSMQRVASNVTNVTKNLERAVNTLSEAQTRMLSNQAKANAGAGGISAYAQSNLNYKPTPVTPKVDYGEITRYNQAMSKQAQVSSNVTGIMSRYSKEIESATRKNDLIASSSNKAGNSINKVGRAAGSAKKQVNALDKVSGMLRRTISGLVVIFGWNLATDLIEIGKNSMDAATQIRLMGQSMGWTNTQVTSFTSRMRELQGLYPKINMSQTAKSVMEMAKTYRLTNSEANRLIKTSAVFTSAMAKEGRSTEDANLALKDYLDGGSGWTRRMQEIGATRERLKATGKWNGDENDVTGKINALDALMQQKGYDELAKNIYTLDDAFNAFKYTLGSVIGEIGEGVTPTIIALTKSVLNAIQGVRGFVKAFQASSFGNQALQIVAVTAAFSGLAIVILKVIGTLWGLIQAKTLITSLASPIGIIVLAVSALAIGFYELGNAMGWWHDFNSMIQAISANIFTLNGQIELIGSGLAIIAGIALSKHFLSDSNIIVRAIDKVIDSIRKYIQALAAKKVAEEADAAATAGKKGTEAAGVAAAGAAEAGTVAAEGKKVSTVSRIFGALGVEYAADAGFMSMFNAGATAIGGMLGAAIPIILGLTAIVAVIIAAIAALAAECVVLLKGLQLLINAMDFGGIDLSPAVQGLKQLNSALWEMAVAMTQMTLMKVLYIINGGIIGAAYQLGIIVVELLKLKAAIPLINSFSSAESINKEAVEKLKSVGTGLQGLATASQAMGKASSNIHWSLFWEWLDGNQLDNLQQAHDRIVGAVPIINSFKDMPNTDKGASEKLKAAANGLKGVSDALEALGKIRGNIGWDRIWEFFDGGTIENLQKAKGRLWGAAKTVASFKDMPAIPNGVGGKLQRLSWTLTDIIKALDLLSKLPPVDDNFGNVYSWADTVGNIKGVLFGVSAQLRTLGDISAIPEGTGQKLQRVTWVLVDVKNAMTTLINVINGLNFDGDYQSIIDSVQTISRAIRGVSVQLNQMQTIANMPEGLNNKLQRIGWVLNDVKTAGNSIKQFSGYTIPPDAVSNVSRTTGAIHRVAIPLRDLGTVANMPEGIGNKLQRISWVLNDARVVANNIKTANASMTGLPDADQFKQKLDKLKTLIGHLANFSNGIKSTNKKGNNASGLSALVRDISTQINNCVNAVNRGIAGLRNAGYRLGNGLRSGVSNGVSNMAHPVWAQINSINSAMSSVQGKVNQTSGVFKNFQSRVYTLTQGINNLGSAITNLPSSKNITIGITTNTSNNGSLPAGVSMSSIDSSDWGTITSYTGGTASTGSLFAGLKGRVSNGLHGAVVRLSGGFDRMSAFESIADTVIGNTSYQYYYNSKNGGDVSDSLRSGSFNCYDGSLVLMSLASLLGLDSEMKGTTVGGEGHAYTKIGGKIFDSTAMQLFGRRTAPRVNYSGTGDRGSTNKEQFSEPVTVVVNVNGDVYGERHLEDKIRSGAEKVVLDVFSPSKGTGM